jgi:hypothetical protein
MQKLSVTKKNSTILATIFASSLNEKLFIFVSVSLKFQGIDYVYLCCDFDRELNCSGSPG